MDPFTAAQVAVEGLGICVSAAKIVKATIENVKHVQEDILAFAQEIDRYHNVLGLLKVASRELLRTDLRDLAFSINEEDIRNSLRALRALTEKLAGIQQRHGQFIAGIRLTILKSEASKLLSLLQTQKSSIIDTISVIHASSSFRTVFDIQKIQADIAKLKVSPAFGEYRSLPSILQDAATRDWLGQTCIETFEQAYNAHRQELADAAYNGEWGELSMILQIGQRRYGENWVNAFRIKPLAQHTSISRWTPLHQAAFWRAPIDVVTKLIGFGAFRSLRTQRSKFAYLDQTPLELATELGYHELIPILTPIVRSPIPSAVLERIEAHFHALIERDFGNRVQDEHFYLPVLEVLTELDGQAMWFGIKKHTFSHAGYLFRLDGRDLVVRSYSIAAEDVEREYRITVTGIFDVENALLINDNA